jgi:uncharacterized protein (UPF0305 family)
MLPHQYVEAIMKAIMKREKDIKSSSSKARVQFDFSKESLDKLDEIKDTVNASTRAEVIRRALTLFTEVLEAENRGAKVMFQEKDGTLARLMLLF